MPKSSCQSCGRRIDHCDCRKDLRCKYCAATLREPVTPPVCGFCRVEKHGAKPL